jgi:predicted SAM-dependent methyltransferase
MIKLNLGCGIAVIKGWVNVDNYFDLESLKKGIKDKSVVPGHGRIDKGAKFIRADIKKLPFKDNYADFAMLDNVLEHISIVDVVPALKEIRRVLKAGGKLRIIVPYIDGLIMDYLHMKLFSFDLNRYMEVMRAFMGAQFHEGEYHRSYFNIDFLKLVIREAGFNKGVVTILPRGHHPPKEFGSIFRYPNKKDGALWDYLIANVEK